MTTPAVTIAARADSRWRCGVEHTSTPRPWPAGSWTPEQLELLVADPMLTVVETDAVPAADDTGGQPTTPTVQAALDTALKALRNATPDEVRQFVTAMAEDGDIRASRHGETVPEDVIAAAIAVLVLGRDDGSWMKDGRPQVKAVEAAVGFDITAAQRDAGWETLQKEGESEA